MILSSVSLQLIVDTLVPVFEGVVDNSLQQQSVSNLRRSSEGEHVDGPESRVSLTQTTASRKKDIKIDRNNKRVHFGDAVIYL